ncbi:MAG: tripartite tricarboxylate transporter TctB family protein, partial [Gammaproteobacteria bacterium]|nr:tripartite tricarboxylate transporter TctB family protein [Gammaproteobacteria bacterium]
AVSDRLGFILTSTILLAVLFWALRVRNALILPLALGVTLLIHTLFYKGLRVPLPWGILLPVQW